jgi:hypothetical protein
VKSVLLHGCETWLVTTEIRHKIQTFVNRWLRHILKTWWPRTISYKDLRKATGQEDVYLEIRKRKFGWIGHTLRKRGWGNTEGHLTVEIPKDIFLWKYRRTPYCVNTEGHLTVEIPKDTLLC